MKYVCNNSSKMILYRSYIGYTEVVRVEAVFTSLLPNLEAK
jgi:hypothetical protein